MGTKIRLLLGLYKMAVFAMRLETRDTLVQGRRTYLLSRATLSVTAE